MITFSVRLERRRTNSHLEKQKRRRADAGETVYRNLTHLLFADDILVVTENRAELQKTLQHMTDVFRRYGLTVNTKKTKWQKDDKANEPPKPSSNEEEENGTTEENNDGNNGGAAKKICITILDLTANFDLNSMRVFFSISKPM